ncbi:MAG: hypothetical protein M0R74_11215 [Dehalococcoidia bacterium]|nr:hypothetical protein [Dehalococcoidia bacterium]
MSITFKGGVAVLGALVASGLVMVVAFASSDTGPTLQQGPPAQEATPAATQAGTQEGHDNLPDEVLEEDAEDYARHYGISEDEAKHRLRQQARSPRIQNELRAVAPDREAGTWVVHEPEFGIVFWYTGDDTGLDKAYEIAPRSPVPIEIRTGAKHTLDELLEILSLVVDSLDRGSLAGAGTKPETGGIVLEVFVSSQYAQDAAGLAARLEAQFGIPVEVQVAERGIELLANTYGGKGLYPATGQPS